MTFGDLDQILTYHDVSDTFLCIGAQKYPFKNLHLMTFDDLDLILTSRDAQNVFSVHRGLKIKFLKICT